MAPAPAHAFAAVGLRVWEANATTAQAAACAAESSAHSKKADHGERKSQRLSESRCFSEARVYLALPRRAMLWREYFHRKLA